jgi:hypothetical protein
MEKQREEGHWTQRQELNLHCHKMKNDVGHQRWKKQEEFEKEFKMLHTHTLANHVTKFFMPVKHEA